MPSGRPQTSPPSCAETPDCCARERLLRAAADLFSRNGYVGTSVGEIVAAAGVTKPVLYYHFQSKEGLYLQVMEEGLGKFRAAIAAALHSDQGTAADRIRRLCETLIELTLENRSIARMTRGLRYAQPQGAPVFDVGEFPRTIQRALLGLVEQGVHTGEFAPLPPTDPVWVIMGLLAACIDSNLVDPALALKPHGFRSALNLVFAGIAPANR